MSSFTFTDQQKAAIIFNKSSIITACPGSGKTAVIQQKIISTTKNSPNYQGVIAITFTKKASEELKKRCTKNGNDTKLSFFGTIDSFCLTEIILPFLSRIWGGRPEDCKIVKKLSSDQMNYFKTDYKTPTYEDLRLDNGFKKLYENGILWMSSFAALSVLILNESSSVRQYIKTRYTHVFIDEYQDSSRSQHELFMKLFELGLIATAVGDTDQSIYQFRGSDPKYLTKLINDENFCHFELSVNHRCHPSIINYASRLINPKNELTLEKDIRVFRVTFKGDLRSAASQITNLIKELLIDKKIKNLSDIAVLGKKEKSLEEFSLNLGIENRLFIDTPLINIGTESAEIYSDLLQYKHNSILTAQEVIERYFWQFESFKIQEVKQILKRIRTENCLELFIENCNEILILLGYENTATENAAVRDIWNNESLLKLFKPLSNNEVQLMTLHKSKGLEFKIVFHIDLEEWSFPYRIPGKNWDDIIYPSLSEDTNLHYVGITRAVQYCILVHTTQRKNANDEYKNSRPSYFFNLTELDGLYKNIQHQELKSYIGSNFTY